jgi:hypothetical protein
MSDHNLDLLDSFSAQELEIILEEIEKEKVKS